MLYFVQVWKPGEVQATALRLHLSRGKYVCYFVIIQLQQVGEDAFYEVLPAGDGTSGLELRFTFASSTAGSFPAVVRFQQTEVGRIQVV